MLFNEVREKKKILLQKRKMFELKRQKTDVIFIYTIAVIIGIFVADLILRYSSLIKSTISLTIIILIFSIITFLLFVKYPEMGLVFYATCLGFLDPVLEPLGIPEGFRAFPFAVLLLFSLIVYLIKERRPINFKKVYFVPISILILLIVGLMWTPCPVYGFHKVKAYILYNLFVFIGVTLFEGDKERLKNMVYISAFLGLIVLISSLFFFLIGKPLEVSKRFQFMGFSSLSLARSIGVFIISYILIAQSSDSFRKKTLLHGMIPFFLLLIYSTGSRMPTISIFTVFLIYLTVIEKRKLWQRIFFIIIFAGISYSVFLYSPEDPKQRYVALYRGEDLEFDYRHRSGRRFSYDISLQAFESHPVIGLGTGGFSDYFVSVDDKNYPHNLILEVASEFGILGLLVIGLFLFYNLVIALKSIFKYRNVRQKPIALFFGILTFLLAFLNSMTTGDLPSNSLIWFGSALMWTAWKTEELTKEKENLKAFKLL